MYSTRVSRHVNAPRPAVYRALVDADAIVRWRVPAGMSGHVHEFDAREGGSFRISLTYDAPGPAGKSSSRTDTYHGRFAELVPDERVVEVLEFETDDPTLRGTMTMTTTLSDAGRGTEVVIVHGGIPTACPPPTTRRASGRRWRTWPRSSRRVRSGIRDAAGFAIFHVRSATAMSPAPISPDQVLILA